MSLLFGKAVPKKLIICPVCQKRGKQEVLGEITPEGHFSILRFHKGLTTIISANFKVQCVCGEIVYQKQEADGSARHW